MANEYVTLPALKLYLNISDDTSDTLLDYARAAASRGIDTFCGRRFYADTSASARVFRPAMRVRVDPDGDLLIVDDISTTTGLVVEAGTAGGSTWTTVATTDYETYPDNAIVLGQPITGVRRILNAWAFVVTDRIRVTAKWGWPAIPDEVVQATFIQATRLFKRKDSPEGVAGFSDLGVVRMPRIDPDVQALVQHLMLPGFA